jgi:hypothetical protein
MQPAPAAGGPLGVQAIMIRIGAGPDFATPVLHHLDARKLTVTLSMAP